VRVAELQVVRLEVHVVEPLVDSFADAVGIHRLFRDWVGRRGAIDQACGIEVVPPNNVVSVVKAVERPDVEGLRGGDAIEALAHIRLDLHLRPRVVPEPET